MRILAENLGMRISSAIRNPPKRLGYGYWVDKCSAMVTTKVCP